MPEFDRTLSELIDRWCDRRAYDPLRVVLPVWPRVSGLTDEMAELMEAFRSLRATVDLPPDEAEQVALLLVASEGWVYRDRERR